MCGRIKAYQFGTTNRFRDGGANPTIDGTYMDGISLTHGNPRQHIWTFAGDEVNSNIASNCPCTNIHGTNGATPPPSFVANNYFCDTSSSSAVVVTFYSSNPLWDGARCSLLSTYCGFNTPPWFYRKLPQPTTDDIEMRVCRDHTSNFEEKWWKFLSK